MEREQDRYRRQVWVRAIALSLFAWVACRPCPARAQTAAELSRARQLYSQGLTLEAGGDWAGALSTFQQVARVKLTPQVRFHLARCKENLGRWNEALGGYRLAEYEATRRSDDPKLIDRIRSARKALEKRIPRLVIRRGHDAADLKVEVDGVVVGAARLDRPMRVDPGPHEIVGILPGGRQFKKSVTASEGQTASVVLDVPAGLSPPQVHPATSATTPPASRPPPPPKTTQPISSRIQGRRAQHASVLPWIIGGVGVAGLAAAGAFYLLRNDAISKLDQGCLGNKCPDTLRSTEEAGKRYTALSGVALGVGVAGIGTALVLLFTQSKKHSEVRASRTVSVSVTAQPRKAGVSLAARF